MSLPFSLPFPLALLGGSVMAGWSASWSNAWPSAACGPRAPIPLLALVSSLGVALILVNCLQFLVGAEIYSFPSGIFGSLPMAMIFKLDGKVLAVRTVQIIILAVSLAMLLVLAWFMNRTRMGKALQATAENPETASLLGINVDRYILSTFFISGALGRPRRHPDRRELRPGRPVFRRQLRPQRPGGHRARGLGSIPGAVLGGVVIGLGEAFLPPDYSSMKEAVAFVMLFVILLARPQGLLGQKTIQKV
jgi:amino acid/amide ABC transporter membrane protein 1, HAAT family (TC 3.A.1.4.-)